MKLEKINLKDEKDDHNWMAVDKNFKQLNSTFSNKVATASTIAGYIVVEVDGTKYKMALYNL